MRQGNEHFPHDDANECRPQTETLQTASLRPVENVGVGRRNVTLSVDEEVEMSLKDAL